FPFTGVIDGGDRPRCAQIDRETCAIIATGFEGLHFWVTFHNVVFLDLISGKNSARTGQKEQEAKSLHVFSSTSIPGRRCCRSARMSAFPRSRFPYLSHAC